VAAQITPAQLPVGHIGFGAMRITGQGVWGPPRDESEAIALLRRVIDRGRIQASIVGARHRMVVCGSELIPREPQPDQTVVRPLAIVRANSSIATVLRCRLDRGHSAPAQNASLSLKFAHENPEKQGRRDGFHAGC
jgi:hypothetical protein